MIRHAASRPELAGLVLAAGAGTRLRPLSDERPKPLCPVGFDALLDAAFVRVAEALGTQAGLAVNLCHGAAMIESHLAAGPWDRVRRSFEPTALGTAGAVAPLRSWLDGRGLLIVNGDTWCPAALHRFVEAWDGERIAVAVHGSPPMHGRSRVVASILPWADARTVQPVPAGLWELFWRDRLAAGSIQVAGVDGPFVDCATVADYLQANVAWLATGADEIIDGNAVHPTATVAAGAVVSRSVIGAGATVSGRLDRCVVWPGAHVGPDEELAEVVRTDSGRTFRADASVAAPR